ncbi:MAG: hypothetical protein WC899_07545 [bacterium]|jgi:hypothetical protein
MLQTKAGRAASPRDAAGCGVEICLSFPFLDTPPYAVLRGDVSLANLLDDGQGRPSAGAGRDATGLVAPALHLVGAPSRLHVGSDTCERLLPSPRTLGAWIDAARGAGWTTTLVLPPLGRDGQARAQECVRVLETAPGAEVVANDWGTVHLLRSRHPDLRITLGRLTHKVLRDPRVADLFDSPQAPMAARSALCRSGELAPGFRTLMERYGIERREIDPFLQPLEEDEWEGRSERLSVHLPYQFVTMGRGCLPAAMHGKGKGKFVAGGPCRKECAKYAVEFRVPVPGGNGAGRHLISFGNALYHAVPPHVSERVLARLSSGGRVDRVVVTVTSKGKPA